MSRIVPFPIADHFRETSEVKTITVFENKLNLSPSLTVAIPTYKRASYLREAVESARNQKTQVSYEIIVVDNNPDRNDETENLMSEYRNIAGISYYKNSQNIGMTGNWNRLYELATTDWIVMLHDDDMIYPDFVSVISRIIESESCDIIFPTYMYTTGDNNQHDSLKCLKLNQNDFMPGRNTIGPPIGFTINKNAMMQLGGFDNNWYPAADYELYCRAVFNGFSALRLFGYPLSFYRIGVNESLRENTILDFFVIERKVFDRINNYRNPLFRNFLEIQFKNRLYQYIKQSSDTHPTYIALKELAERKEKDISFFSKLYMYILDKYTVISQSVRSKKIAHFH